MLLPAAGASRHRAGTPPAWQKPASLVHAPGPRQQVAIGYSSAPGASVVTPMPPSLEELGTASRCGPNSKKGNRLSLDIAAYNLAENPRDREHLQSFRSPVFRKRHRVGDEDLVDCIDGVEPCYRGACEQTVCAHNGDPPDVVARGCILATISEIVPAVAISSSTIITSLLRTSPIVGDRHVVVAQAILLPLPPSAHSAPSRASLCAWHVRRPVPRAPRCSDPSCGGAPGTTECAVRWSVGTVKKPCTCGECSVIGDDLRRAGGNQHVGNQACRDRDPRCILLGSCIGKVGDHGRRRPWQPHYGRYPASTGVPSGCRCMVATAAGR